MRPSDAKKPQASFSAGGSFSRSAFIVGWRAMVVLPDGNSHFLDQNFEKFVLITMGKSRGFLAKWDNRDKFRRERADAR